MWSAANRGSERFLFGSRSIPRHSRPSKGGFRGLQAKETVSGAAGDIEYGSFKHPFRGPSMNHFSQLRGPLYHVLICSFHLIAMLNGTRCDFSSDRCWLLNATYP